MIFQGCVVLVEVILLIFSRLLLPNAIYSVYTLLSNNYSASAAVDIFIFQEVTDKLDWVLSPVK